MAARRASLAFDFTTPTNEGAAPPVPPTAFTVGELARLLRRALDDAFDVPIYLEGEVSSARPATSGHLYFALKDEHEDASIDVAMYRTSLTPRARGLLVDGARVRLRGKPSFWAPRGRLQFVADRAEPAGQGALLEALARLKEKLAAEGLFSAERKRPLPADPRIVGVVTSASGAAVHDICKVAFRRGGARILLAPALVQGAGAAESMRRALEQLARVRSVDVIILGRGGGSSDDLGAFNDEALVRAVAACPVPVVSAVGHEIDVSLTDLAADVRAATPSQAAELVVPDARARRELLGQLCRRAQQSVERLLAEQALRLSRLERRLGDPRFLLVGHAEALDEKTEQLAAAMRRAVEQRRERLGALRQRLAFLHPSAVVQRERAAASRLRERLASAMAAAIDRRQVALAQATAQLDAMSPKKVLARGYAIVTGSDGIALRRAADTRIGEVITVQLHEGSLGAEVRAVHDEEGR